ncbi:DUF4345 domain-containing protein [Actinoplanes sichuanensis]|uniref:DUF4345 domain-containing protein n=1 Tax=Actinoplanes sichuanensis TaxID=512349 RepID=A0ABW4AHL7_9ACTN|nr:DUF4345 domain-containing protein [Actinoplanes sichuanensis]
MTTLPQRIVLAVSGLVIVLIGAAGLFTPVWFREVNGIRMGPDVALLSETRAAGALLLAAGVTVLLGAFVPRLARTAAAVGAVGYLVTALARLVSLAADGSPGGGLLFAAVVELALGLACAALLRTPRRAAMA